MTERKEETESSVEPQSKELESTFALMGNQCAYELECKLLRKERQPMINQALRRLRLES
jgi:hypothetical protein